MFLLNWIFIISNKNFCFFQSHPFCFKLQTIWIQVLGLLKIYPKNSEFSLNGPFKSPTSKTTLLLKWLWNFISVKLHKNKKLYLFSTVNIQMSLDIWINIFFIELVQITCLCFLVLYTEWEAIKKFIYNDSNNIETLHLSQIRKDRIFF